MPKKSLKTWGELAFILGVLLAIVTGLFTTALNPGTVGRILVVAGLIVGFLNIQEKETGNFLVAAIALMLVGTAGVDRITLLNLGPMFKNVVTNIAIFVAPAAAVVSLKVIVDLAKK
ncbi:MAG: hypothetical protein GW780_03055 [Candidatus Aenigmarchaeota archaeon]|nr:hypothetical protein [Candidatus Aenigmarchaeota archaeon]